MAELDHVAAIRKAVQDMLDSHGDGYCCQQIVIAMGLERVTYDGKFEAIPWVWCPEEQADWQSTALLEAALDLRAQADVED